MINITSYLENRSKEELIEFLLQLAREFPGIKDRLSVKACLELGEIDSVLLLAKNKIKRLADSNAFIVEGFDEISEYLKNLFSQEYYNEIVSLGEHFLKYAPQSYEHGVDLDWEIQCGIEVCMATILDALVGSRLPAAQKLIWYIKASIDDEYGVIKNDYGFAGRLDLSIEDWGEVQHYLTEQIRVRTPRFYKHEYLVRWLTLAQGSRN